MTHWKQEIRQYGSVHATSIKNAESELKAPEDRLIETYRRKDQADICLKCTKPNCNGSEECFNKRRKELEDEKKTKLET